MLLTEAREGKILRIARISGTEEERRKLARKGLVVDNELEIISCRSGSMIVSVQGRRIALDRSMAEKVHF